MRMARLKRNWGLLTVLLQNGLRSSSGENFAWLSGNDVSVIDVQPALGANQNPTSTSRAHKDMHVKMHPIADFTNQMAAN